MNIKLSRRTWIRIISYVAAAIFVATGFFLRQRSQIANLTRYVSNTHQHAFSELTTAMDEIHTSLQKGLYTSSSTMLSAICVDLFGKAMSAQMALGEIPYANVDLEKTSDFVARVGDYALSLSQRAAAQETLSETDRENLRSLSEIAGQLSDSLIQLQSNINNGIITLEDFETARKRLSQEENSEAPQSGGLQEMEREFPELPTLIYDGPFSSHIDQQQPLLLEGLQEVSEDQALEKLTSISGLKTDMLQAAGTGEGKIPTYRFSSQSENGQIYAEVTRIGGILLNYSCFQEVGDPVYSPEECVDLARTFLTNNQFESMQESYWTAYEGTVTINFAYRQGDVLCYPDLIKVSVARDTGAIVGFEATGYVMCHTQRDIPDASISLEDARTHIVQDLEVISERMVIIPSAGKEERLCYEFKCTTQEGQHYILYINALTGNEEKILLLLEDENGTLAL